MAIGNVLTARELGARPIGVCGDAKIYAYTGSDGTKVQAECSGYHDGGNHDPQLVLLVSSPNCIPSGGGPSI